MFRTRKLGLTCALVLGIASPFAIVACLPWTNCASRIGHAPYGAAVGVRFQPRAWSPLTDHVHLKLLNTARSSQRSKEAVRVASAAAYSFLGTLCRCVSSLTYF